MKRTLTLSLFIATLCFADEKKPDPEGGLWNKEYEKDKHKLNAYKEHISKLFKEKDADVLLPVLIAIEEGALTPKVTKLEEIKSIFGEDEVKKINNDKYYTKIQKGKGRKSYLNIGGGFIPQETNEWFLICNISNGVITSFDFHFGLESALD
jgi:endonuclease IV